MGSQARQGDEHPAYALLWSMAHLPLPMVMTHRQAKNQGQMVHSSKASMETDGRTLLTAAVFP